MSRYFLFILLFCIVFISSENIYIPLKFYDVASLTAFLALAFLFFSLTETTYQEMQSCKLSLLVLFLFSLCFSLALGLIFSTHLDVGLYPAMKSMTALILGVGLVLYLRNREKITELLGILLVGCGIHSLFTILQQSPETLSLLHGYLRTIHGSSHGKPWEASVSTFYNANYFSGYLIFNIPVCFYFLTTNRTKMIKIGVGFTLILILLGLAFSTSSGGQLVGMIQITAAAGYLLKGKPWVDRKRVIEGGFIVILILGVSYAVLYSWLNPTKMSPTTTASVLWTPFLKQPFIFDNLLGRIVYWQVAYEIFKNNLMLGSGLWTFREVYPFFHSGLDLWVKPEFMMSGPPPHAHSLYMQTAAESGLVGLSLLGGCIALLYMRFIKVWRSVNNRKDSLVFFIFLSLTGFLLQNLIESNWLNSLFVYYFVIFVVIVDKITDQQFNVENPSKVNVSKNRPTIFIFSFLITMMFSVWYYKYENIVQEKLLQARTMEEFHADLNRAKSICSNCVIPYQISLLRMMEKYNEANDPALLDMIEKEFQKAIVLNPYGLIAEREWIKRNKMK